LYRSFRKCRDSFALISDGDQDEVVWGLGRAPFFSIVPCFASATFWKMIRDLPLGNAVILDFPFALSRRENAEKFSQKTYVDDH